MMTAYDENRALWYVLRAFKKEAQAEARLTEDGRFSFYIPKHCITQTYHGKKKTRLVPVLPSLLFVRGTRKDLLDLKQECGYLQFAMIKNAEGPEYMVVPDRQMEDFIKISSAPENVRYYGAGTLHLQQGTPVRITGGPFAGVQGTFVKLTGRRSRQLVVELPHLLAASVEVAPEDVEVLK